MEDKLKERVSDLEKELKLLKEELEAVRSDSDRYRDNWLRDSNDLALYRQLVKGQCEIISKLI